MKFSEVTEKELDFIVETYNYYIKNSTCIYFTNPLTRADVKNIIPFAHATYKTYIAVENNDFIGFCYFNRLKQREAFDISVEITIYIAPQHIGKNCGEKLLHFLEENITQLHFKNIVATVNDTNISSKKLLERNNYQCVGQLTNIAEKFGKKLTLLFYQKELSIIN